MLKSQPGGSNSSLKAEIPALRLKSQPRSSNPSLKAQIPASGLKSQPQGSNLNFEADILALRLRSQLQGSNHSSNPFNLQSIGHQPLWGRCPNNHHIFTLTNLGASGTADHVMLLRLFSLPWLLFIWPPKTIIEHVLRAKHCQLSDRLTTQDAFLVTDNRF